jgi:hypothetical protein
MIHSLSEVRLVFSFLVRAFPDYVRVFVVVDRRSYTKTLTCTEDAREKRIISTCMHDGERKRRRTREGAVGLNSHRLAVLQAVLL